MFGLFWRLCSFIGFCVIVLAVLVVVRNPLVALGLSWAFERETSFTLEIGETDLALQWPLSLELREVVVKNPPDFPSGNALELDRVEIVFGPKPWVEGRLEMEELRAVLRDWSVTRKEGGESNLIRLSHIAERRDAEAPFLVAGRVQVQVVKAGHEHVRRYEGVKTLGQWVQILAQLPAHATGRR